MATKTVEKKDGFMAKTRQFLKGSWNELKRVHWPNRKELITYTGVVLTAVAVVAAMIWIVDSILNFGLQLFL